MRLIEIPQWGTLNLIEAIWLFSGLVALGFALLRIRSLWGDYMATKKIGQDDLCIIARGYLRREAIRIAQAITIIGIGIYAGLDPPAIPGPARTSITGLVLTAALILVSALVSIQSLLDWRDREEVRRILEDKL